MAKTTYRGAVEVSEDIDMDRMLARLPIEFRNKAAQKAIKENVKEVARVYRSTAARGKTGNLKRSITHRVIPYQGKTVWFGLAGTIKPTGNHHHLVELGHKVFRRGPKGDSAKEKNLKPLTGKSRIEGKYDLAKAIDTTRTARDKKVLASLEKSIKEAGG